MKRKFIVKFCMACCMLLLLLLLASCGQKNAGSPQQTEENSSAIKNSEGEQPSEPARNAENEDDSEYAVRVGAVTYTVKQVQAALDEVLLVNESAGAVLSEEEKVEAAENTMENFVIRGLAENRISELGLDEIDKQTAASIKEQANLTYEEIWQQMRSQYGDDELTDRQITMLLEEAGSTPEAYYRELVLGYELELLLEYYGVSVKLSDKELDAFYLENYVAPYEERYADNIPLYEEEVLFGEGDSLFIPEGYRRISQIFLPLPEDIQASMDEWNADAEKLTEKAQKAYEEVAQLGVEGKDISAAQNDYAEAKAELEKLEVEKGRLLAEVLPREQKTIDEIFARLKAGESFESLSRLYGEETTDLPYHPDSKAWTENYAQALRTLKTPGDVSQPIVVEDGVHIFCYAEDIPFGAVTLSGDQRSFVEAAAQQNLSSKALTDLVKPWRSSYEIETDISKLTLTN